MDPSEISDQQWSQRGEGSSSHAQRRRFSPYSPNQTTSSTPSPYTSSLPPAQRGGSATHVDDQGSYFSYLSSPIYQGTPPSGPEASPGWNDTVPNLYQAPFPYTHPQFPSSSSHVTDMQDFAFGFMDPTTTYPSSDYQFVHAPDHLSPNAIENFARMGISDDPGVSSSPQQTSQADSAASQIAPPSEQNSPSTTYPFGFGVSLSADHAGGLYRSTDHEAAPHRDDATEDEGDSILSVSTAFHPGSLPHLPPADVIVVSSDGTLFYVHAATLRSAAPHVFRTVLHGHGASITFSTGTSNDYPTNSATATFEAASWIVQRYLHAGSSGPHVWLKMDLFPADELNIMLHAFYNTPCDAHQPSIEVIESALDKMSNHLLLDIDTLAKPSTALFAYLILLAPVYPLRIYTTAARYQIHDLAVKASSHLLSLSLSSLTDDEAASIGAVYLKKLYLLHLTRKETLRNLLLDPLHPHPPIRGCSFKDQKATEGLWASAVVKLVWDVRPDLSSTVLQESLSPVTDRLECELCRESLNKRIKDMVKSWTSVPDCIT